MATAAEEAKRLATLPPDEPVFVLRAQDMLAADTIRWWCGQYFLKKGKEDAKSREALDIAERFDQWSRKKLPG